MLEEIGWDNQRWVKILIEQLVKQGVHLFCLAPGSRNTPLLIAAAEHPDVESIVHFDERGVAFHALGIGKATGKPAALICTSGTGVGNLLPAIMEADASFIPLIVITADRPPELRDNGANQTTEQAKIFHNHMRWQVDLSCPGKYVPEAYAATTIAQAVYRSVSSPKGPVHINVMLREPFFCTKSVPEPNAFFTEYGSVTSLPDARTISTWKNKIESSKNGVIIVGSMEHRTSREPIYELARKLNWPIFSDVISGCRMDGEQSHQIPHFDPILKANQEMRPDAVLHFGDRFVSKTLLEWLNDSAPAFYGLAADHPCRHDPKHLITHRVSCAPDVLCNSLLPLLEDRSDLNWFEMWKNCANRATEQLKDYFQNESQVSEPGIFHWLKDHLPDAWDLFIANSMPIRDADNYYYPLKPSGTVFANRGISGIDGNIATSIGIARGLERPLLAVLGDLAVLHDLNSLAQIKKSAQPLILIIINNGGGGIFSFLPVAERTVHFEKFIAAAHALRFEHAAKLFDLPHYPSADWQTGISELLKQKKSGIIEITTHRGENHRLHQQLTETIKQACYQPV